MTQRDGFRIAGSGGDTGRERIADPAWRDRILTYLRDGAPVRPAHRTDGRWIWPETTIDELAAHGLAPEPELYRRIADRGGYCPPVTQAMVDAAEAAMRRHTTG